MKNIFKKTLLVKYLAMSLVIVLSSFIVLGAMLVVILTSYSVDETENALCEDAKAVSALIGQNSVYQDGKILVTNQIYHSLLTTMSKSINANIVIVNTSGEIQLTSEPINEDAVFYDNVPVKIINQAKNGDYFQTGNLGGVYSESYYVAGEPIYIDYNGNSYFVGVVFVGSTSSSVFEFTREIIQIFIIAAVVTFLIIFFVIGIFTYRMVKPLIQMSEATKSFAKGDFSIRVPVNSSDEIGQLAVAFNDMADALATSEGTRRSFIANVSHELKTPMTTISGFIDGIQDGTIPPERQNYYLSIVSTEVKRLSRLVQSMLSLSRIDSGKLKVQKIKFDLTSTLISTILTFEQKLHDKNITVNGLDELSPTYVDGDSDMIHQVIYNLIENASKFTNQDGYINISLQDMNDKIELSIENSGQGISSEEIVQIFDRFYKTDKSRSQDKNGMGLGLYIVKKIMLLHNGDISATSSLGQSCKFTLWLPKTGEKEDKTKALKGGKIYE